MPEPMRLNRYLALKGVASRREADRLISAGKVLINGQPAVLGTKVNDRDQVEINQDATPKRTYLLCFKPAGELAKLVGQYSDRKLTLLEPLDKETAGLVIATNDGRLTARLPDCEQEYHVCVDKKLTPMFQKAIANGVKLEDTMSKPCQLKKINNQEFNLILTENKANLVRRMCAALGYQVTGLKRTRIANLTLAGLKSGQQKIISPLEQEKLLKILGI